MKRRTPIQIVSVQGQSVYARKEDGHIVQVHLTSAQKGDNLFFRILKKIASAHLWLPMDDHQQLLDESW